MPATLTVIGGDTLLTASVAALLRDLGHSALLERPLPEASGVRVAHGPTGRWMFVSAQRGPDAAAAAALSEGASSALNLDSREAEIVMAVRALTDGGHGYVPIDMMRWIAGEAVGRAPGQGGGPLAPALTGRERDILRLVSRGYSNNEIAAALTISINTVRTHLHTLSVKLEAKSRTRMLANARALAIPESFDSAAAESTRNVRVPA